jgi:hypothetical protein
MEGPELDLTFHVHDTLFVFWVAMFYLPILPISLVAALFAFYTNVMYLKLKILTQHKLPKNVDNKLVNFVSQTVPWMVYCAAVMQLLYVRWAGWHVNTLVDKKDLPIIRKDFEFMETLSFWFFVGCSGYMVLPLRRIIEWFKDCCATHIAPISKPQNTLYNDENYDSVNPMTKTEGRIRSLKQIIDTLKRNLAEL